MHTLEHARGTAQFPSPAPVGSDNLVDPVCGMAVTAQSLYHLVHAVHPIYFCSAHCRDKFAAAPQKYALARPASAAVAAKDTPNSKARAPTPTSAAAYTFPCTPKFAKIIRAVAPYAVWHSNRYNPAWRTTRIQSSPILGIGFGGRYHLPWW